MSHLQLSLSARPRPRGLWLAAAVAVLAACVLAGAALAPGGAGKGGPFAVTQLAPKSAPNPLAGRLTKVYGTNIPASRYGTEVADLEDEGTNLAGEQISELSPLPAAAFTAPVDEYRAYSERWIAHALSGAVALQHALAAGERTAAMSAWEATWSDYLHLGAVYLNGAAEAANRAIDGTPGELPGGTSDPHFTGLHRIEMGLWGGQTLSSLIGFAVLLQHDLSALRGIVAHVEITPLEYATRSHEIIEDDQRDLLSGMDVPWSRQGVLGTAAGLAATEEVFHTLEPLLSGRENTEGEVRVELLMLHGVLASMRARHHGQYPNLSGLSIYEHEQLNGYVAGALSALEEMPGTLETKVRPPVPRLPEPSRVERAEERAAEKVAGGAP
ncbi:MAG TPA: EfeM/EfeO family lipoprotein [Solirubrobacteraceae bacterium]|nr:EfeM/EfeO family lipoprotein [Solirubrobacteraceae bacterium]